MGKVIFAFAGVTPSGTLLFPAWVVVMSGSLMIADLYRRKEVMLLNNLGIPVWRAAAAATVPALALETLLVLLRP
jgi:hypothetical protein